ncbi:unnamed protein product [Dibothriocephalus latus]|uniref:ferroxidase n=1 Tax=Dibothriocephalus latus TaxID=60516 RepID=A0A3P7LRJ7_DIBLA|nr:unnamed protein product [Dibothriocephalus latus]
MLRRALKLPRIFCALWTLPPLGQLAAFHPQLARPLTSFPSVFKGPDSKLGSSEFEKLAEYTLDYLAVAVEDLADSHEVGLDFDVSLSDGVLNICFGDKHGTYVINKQSFNKQIWFSSPTSGPKRFDYDPNTKSWIYSHDKTDLFRLMSTEFSLILGCPVTLKLPY